MEPTARDTDPDKKIKDLEHQVTSLERELSDLRQGLTTVFDFYRDLAPVSRKQDAVEVVDREIARQQVEDDQEFEGIWRFHEEMLVGDPAARISFEQMYGAFIGFCAAKGRAPVDREAFDFVFAHMQNPAPEMDRGMWIGYRLRTEGK